MKKERNGGRFIWVIDRDGAKREDSRLRDAARRQVPTGVLFVVWLWPMSHQPPRLTYPHSSIPADKVAQKCHCEDRWRRGGLRGRRTNLLRSKRLRPAQFALALLTLAAMLNHHSRAVAAIASSYPAASPWPQNRHGRPSHERSRSSHQPTVAGPGRSHSRVYLQRPSSSPCSLVCPTSRACDDARRRVSDSRVVSERGLLGTYTSTLPQGEAELAHTCTPGSQAPAADYPVLLHCCNTTQGPKHPQACRNAARSMHVLDACSQAINSFFFSLWTGVGRVAAPSGAVSPSRVSRPQV